MHHNYNQHQRNNPQRYQYNNAPPNEHFYQPYGRNQRYNINDEPQFFHHPTGPGRQNSYPRQNRPMEVNDGRQHDYTHQQNKPMYVNGTQAMVVKNLKHVSANLKANHARDHINLYKLHVIGILEHLHNHQADWTQYMGEKPYKKLEKQLKKETEHLAKGGFPPKMKWSIDDDSSSSGSDTDSSCDTTTPAEPAQRAKKESKEKKTPLSKKRKRETKSSGKRVTRAHKKS